LNFEFRETPRGEVVIYRGVELSEASLESYRKSVGHLLAWPTFTSFTEKREDAEEYVRAWRGGIPVLFELRSELCPRLLNGDYVLHPFAVLEVESVTGNAVKLVEVEVLEPARVREVGGERPGVTAKGGVWTVLHEAAKCGDVRAISRLVARQELLNARDAEGWTPLAVAACSGRTEAVKALASLGASVNTPMNGGATPVFVATQGGHESTVRALTSLGANVNTPGKDGWTPLMRAAWNGNARVVSTLLKAGASAKASLPSGETALSLARSRGHADIVALLEKA
jgi:hypothetical protein